MLKNKILVAVNKLDFKIVNWLNQNNLGIELDFFSYPENLDNQNLDISINYHKELLSLINNKITMHGAFYDLNITARDAKIVDVAKFRINQSIEIAKKLNIKDIVFHPNYVHSSKSDYIKFWTNKQVEFWQQFISQIEQDEINIYLENTRENDASYISNIIDNLNNKHFKVCFDTGHSNCFTNSKIKPAEWVKNYNNKLNYIHLHSNFGYTDEHLAFTKGNIDFDNFFEEISKLNSDLLIIIEVKTFEEVIQSLKELQKYCNSFKLKTTNI